MLLAISVALQLVFRIAVSAVLVVSAFIFLYSIYALTKRDGFGFRLAFINDDFIHPHPDHDFMTKLFDYVRARAHADNVGQNAPPGF